MKMTYAFQSAKRPNGRPPKPWEDYIALGENACVVADGVTQNLNEYSEGMTASHASEAARLTAEAILAVVCAAPDPTLAARRAVKDAIAATAAYNAAHVCPFPAAAVFVSGTLRGDTLHFAYVGDSVITLLREGVRIRLSEPQTAHLRVMGSTSGMGITKRQLYDTITNNAQSPLGYGVIDGDERALDFLRAARLALRAGDRVIFSSDGIDRYLSLAPIGELARLSAEELLDRSEPFDRPPYNSYADDKAVVVLDVNG
ncbi:MAG: hypothetical protein J5998_11635 [Clostridia bacterium]|nr:hypothetical protein [Clostridia bacterium]